MIFLPGKIYYTTYGNFKHDSKPLIFVLHSDYNKTHALNIHYLPAPLLLQFFNYIKKFNMKFPAMGYGHLGKMIYSIMKQYYPQWAKYCYRTYKSQLLNGYLINDGITTKAQSVVARPSMEELKKRDAYIKMLNENVRESAVLDRIIPKAPVSNFSRPAMGMAPVVNRTQAPQQGQTTIMRPANVPLTTNMSNV